METLKHNGFSLIELLITLSIWILLLSLSVPVLISLQEKKTEDNFLLTLQNDIIYIQNVSLGSKTYNRIILDRYSYRIVDNKNASIVRNLPDGWEIDRRTLEEISFNRNGTIRKAGTIQIRTKQNKFNMIFPIGKGRGYLEKQ
ncbi:competence type IV pilus minor pilin ComGD [Ornithinibacillus contaminans]|uniref:competence type IV pilus minor pilin ComGD n=1 Tax=Ornithinibacillus contaminans TaxID=694055 RepID=UPI00064D78AE|nr:competence type IV pilus minor pilin ComGD [Ornithinibacillus contaminans]